MHRKICSLLVFVLLSTLAFKVQAQTTSRRIPFSGTATGQGIVGSADLTFSLFNVATGGTPLGYTDSQLGVAVVADDSFSTVLGDGSGGDVPADIFAANTSVYIAIELSSAPGVEIGPRVPIYSSGYAHFAVPDNAVTTAKIQDMAVTGAKIEDSAITSVKIAAASVDSSKIVDGSIGASQVDSTQVQRRVTEGCLVGSAIRVIDAAGTVTCQPTGGGGGIGGNGTANQIPKFTAATTVGDSAISEVGGNVGIGTASPSARLDVSGDLHVVQSFLIAPKRPATDDLIYRQGELTIERKIFIKPPFGEERSTIFKIAQSGNVSIGTSDPVGSALRVVQQHTNGDGISAHVNTTSGTRYVFSATSNTGVGLHVKGDGNVGIGTQVPQAKLDVVGTTRTGVLQITGGADLSEQFEVNGVSPERIQPGMVVAIDPKNPGKLILSSQAYDRKVAGVISGAGDLKPGMLMSQSGSIANGEQPVALTGRVYAWADASKGPIQPGDLLTTSNAPGHAMKATDHAKAKGAIIGKAMTGLKEGRGLVLVLVTLQ